MATVKKPKYKGYPKKPAKSATPAQKLAALEKKKEVDIHNAKLKKQYEKAVAADKKLQSELDKEFANKKKFK